MQKLPARFSRRRTFLVLMSLAVPVIIAVLWLFRTENIDNPELGQIQHKYRWGVVRELLADTNRDGQVDFRALFGEGDSRSSPQIGPHDYPTEFWEDKNFDGIFELHAVYSNEEISRIELDDDGDGHFETVLTGVEAKDYYPNRAEKRAVDLRHTILPD